MYATAYLGIESDNGNATNYGVPALSGQTVTFYMLIQNPLDEFEFNAMTTQNKPHNDLIAYDGLVFVPTVTFTANAGTLDTTLSLGGTNLVKDIKCTAATQKGKYDATNCKADDDATYGKTNNYTQLELSTAAAGYCTEVWKIGGLSERCVRAGFKVQRLFQTNDNGSGTLTAANSVDIDFEFRKYSITTGWLIPTSGATQVPGKQDFAAVSVDWGAFLRAPETYSAAVQNLSLAGSAIVTAIIATAF